MTQLGEVQSPVAAKQHQCDWCAGTIEIGEKYSRWTWIDEAPATIKAHAECRAAMAEQAKETGEQEVEFFPGDNPRGCWCGFDRECTRCKEPSNDG